MSEPEVPALAPPPVAPTDAAHAPCSACKGIYLPPWASQRIPCPDRPDSADPQDLCLSARAANVLRAIDCRTLGDLRRLDDKALLRVWGCGRLTLKEIREVCPSTAAAAAGVASTENAGG